jgi:catechol 2,3-dioxygenase-like lactoylglutathione lyase family enzyme
MKVLALHHVRFGVTDLDKAEAFARDFGLKTVDRDATMLVMRTSGCDAFNYVAEQATERGLRGIALTVARLADLREAIARHGATPVRALDTPGGGWGVSLTDPEGLRIDLVTNIAERPAEGGHAPLQLNLPHTKDRHHIAQSVREMGPATLFRLGHIGLFVRDFAVMAAWYQDVLGMKISDTLHVPHKPEQKVVGFFRVDRGDELVDHHTIFLAQFGKTDCHHISFEVQDFEAQFIAHRWLEKQGWKPNWGVGRHPLGSHVFDVWFDPDGYRWETFSDTDVVDAAKESGNHDLHGAHMDMWSSQSPDRYFA